MDNQFLLIGGVLFVAVFLVIEGAYVWWNSTRGPEMQKIGRRLQNLSAGGSVDPDSARMFKQRLLANSTGMSRWLLQFPRFGGLDRLLVQSGVEITVSTMAGVCVAMFTLSVVTTLTMRLPLWLALLVSLCVAWLPIQWIMFKRAQRMTRFELLLPEALDLIGRGLRAGHAFPSALQLAGNEMPDPVGFEFRQTFDEINFGVDVHTALQNFARRVPITDLGFFVIAVTIQRESGGNLSEVLENISAIIRDRLKLFGRIKTLSAEGRLSAWILVLLPFATLAMMYAVNRELTSLLWTDPTGLKLVYGMLISMVLGVLWIRAIIKIRV
jgi:tight adherence protein B